MPKQNKGKHLISRKLEDYEPGATRSDVLKVLKKVATSPKPSPKRDSPPEQA